MDILDWLLTLYLVGFILWALKVVLLYPTKAKWTDDEFWVEVWKKMPQD